MIWLLLLVPSVRLGCTLTSRARIPRLSAKQFPDPESSQENDLPRLTVVDSVANSARTESLAFPTTLEKRLRQALPCGDEIDRQLAIVAFPSMANLVVAPLVGAVDTFWVGRMGSPLALAGQGAANTCFFACYFLVAFIPTVTAPLVASAAGEGDMERAKERICNALYLANAIGFLGMLLLVCRPDLVLGLVMSPATPAYPYAMRYLRFRSISMVPALFSAVSFAAFRGTLDTITPLKVSVASNLFNLVLDPILIFTAKLGVAGAALATALAEILSGVVYLALLLRRKLASWRQMLSRPSFQSLIPLLQGAVAMLLRQAALNLSFLAATRSAQRLDASGVAAAAYCITNQMYSLGLVIMLAIQSTGATVVPSAIAKSGVERGRQVADRLLAGSLLSSLLLSSMQLALLEPLTMLFTTVPEVREAVRQPAFIAAMVQLINGPVFAGEGILMGVGAFDYLAAVTAIGVTLMLIALQLSSRLGGGINAIWVSVALFHVFQFIAVVAHHLFISPLALKKRKADEGQARTP